MMCVINYLSACRRLKECDKFIKLQGRKNLPDQILAQRDMIELEKTYYGEETQSLLFYIWMTLLLIVFCGGLYFVYVRLQNV